MVTRTPARASLMNMVMRAAPVFRLTDPNPTFLNESQISSSSPHVLRNSSFFTQIRPKTHSNFSPKNGAQSSGERAETGKNKLEEPSVPSMADILVASRAQKLELELKTLGPFFRITARSLGTRRELGRAEGLIRIWFSGRILHLDSIRLRRETLGMERSIFGIGLFIGAVAIRHGYDCGCQRAELLAINDSDLYHSKLVRFYRRIGFEVVHEVTGSTIGDMTHMLVWGGIGTRMDASIDDLLMKWCSRFKTS